MLLFIGVKALYLYAMNNDVQYVIRGALLAFLFIIAVSAADRYIPKHLFTFKEAIVTDSIIKDTIPVIQNIAGQNLFNENCASCHRLHGCVLGPSVRGVEDRVKDRTLLREWIRNSNKVLQSGNAYFNNLVKECGNVRMTGFPQLTDDQIDAMLDYIKEVDTKYPYQ